MQTTEENAPSGARCQRVTAVGVGLAGGGLVGVFAALAGVIAAGACAVTTAVGLTGALLLGAGVLLCFAAPRL